MDNNLTGECAKGLAALGLNKKKLLLTSAKTTSQNGLKDFWFGGSGLLIHELSHSARLRNDAGLYALLKGKVKGLPAAGGKTGVTHADALDSFFNNNCK
ncbi:MAG: hypothetical protein ACRENF_03980 [Thermodesulfobacteriota bacterium]